MMEIIVKKMIIGWNFKNLLKFKEVESMVEETGELEEKTIRRMKGRRMTWRERGKVRVSGKQI